jgi:hypothetical protein
MVAVGRHMNDPEERTSFENGHIDSVTFGGATINRNTYEPGWRWSRCVGPLYQTDSCSAHHIGYIVSGTLHVETEDGSVVEVCPGTAYEILPGHDGWVVGDEQLVAVESFPAP